MGGYTVERELGLEDVGVRISLRALADGGSRLVHPRTAANGEFGNRTQCVGDGGASAFHEGNYESMVLADGIVRALLTVSRQVEEGEVVAGQSLVAGDPGTFANREREV